MKSTWDFYSAGQLHFGFGASQDIGQLVGQRGWKRVLVITDPVLAEVGHLDGVIASLAKANVQADVFKDSSAEPAIEVAEAAIAQAGAFQPDAIIGLGGGSNMDLAKVTAVVYTHGGQPADYFGFDNVPGPVTPLVCVPTTAGTGSEVSHAAVLTDTANAMKVSTLSNYLRPDLAVVDPELTMSCPAQVTADSGIDVLTHAIEGYTAIDFDRMHVPVGEACAYEGKFPLADCIAEKAIALVGQHLVTAVHEPENRAAREGMALASTLAGLAFSNAGVALVHALEYPLGGELHCSHGAGNGLLLPYVMQFNLPERISAFAKIARLLGADIDNDDDDAAAQAAIDAVFQLRREIGIPDRIRDLGGTEDQLAGFAEKSFAIKRLMWVNPREPSQEDLLGILQSAF